MKTKNYAIDFVAQNQAMKELTINNAINKIDFFINRAVHSFIKELPEQCNYYDIFIIKDAGQGLSQHQNKIAFYQNGKWNFIMPEPSIILYITDLKAFYLYDNSREWLPA